MPTSALDAIAKLDAVQEITAPDYRVNRTGRKNTQGDGILRANLVRYYGGITGKGVKVGVISDGVDARRTAQSSGDLPATIEIDPGNRGSGDEGTALLEIVHDLAPKADLAFSATVPLRWTFTNNLQKGTATSFFLPTAFPWPWR